ncbi:MAG: extracellular solute-binding protein [Candidatus Portnoybacteria bacterium]|nr:extracellular solute-binding protein [Candidatus Portnoybacteria bacterium]
MSKIKTTTLYTLIVPIIFLSLTAALPGCKEPLAEEVELEFWGVFDDSDIYRPLIEDFNLAFPKIKINYYKKTYQTYEKDLLEAMAGGRGPDIFMMHHTWLPRYEDKIWAAPSELITLKELTDNFVDVVYTDFVSDGYITALPLSIDTLALYYNKDIFNTAGLPQPPTTWEEFLTDVEKLTIKDERDNIIRAGVALGTARNVNRSTDILSLLMLQSGAQMVNEQRTSVAFNQSVNLNGESFYPGQRALEFYTDFANPLKSVYTWNTRMNYSLDSFSEGKVVMMLNYSYQTPIIRAKSPYLNFGIAPMPQIETSTNNVNYANYWGLTVSHNCQNANEAWQFIIWLTDKENAQKYLELTEKPTARRDLILGQKDDPDLAVFAEQTLTAYSWEQVDNSTIEQYFADMIESVVLGAATIQEAINRAASDITFLMK